MAHLKSCSLLFSGLVLLGLSGCSNNNGGNGLTNDTVSNSPIKLFGETSTDKQAIAAETRSVKTSINQADLKKAIHRYRITAKITGGAQQIVGVDLNGDGQGEALVYFEGAEWCISTGCRMVLFSKTPNGFRNMATIQRVKKPVMVSPHGTSGWRDLIVRTGNAGIGERSVALKFKGNYPPNATMVQEKLAELPPASEVLFPASTVAVGAN
jgi:hypothetical protein